MVTQAAPSPGRTAPERGQVELLLQRIKEHEEDARDLRRYAARVFGLTPDTEKAGHR